MTIADQYLPSTDLLPEGASRLYYTDARARAALSCSASGLDYSSETGALSLATGYVIPTTTEETNWNTAFGWGSHASAGYLKADGSVDLTTDWTIAAQSITLTAGTLAAAHVKDSSLTSGRVWFSGTGGQAADDSALVWDNDNKRLGVGETPAGPLGIYAPAKFVYVDSDVGGEWGLKFRGWVGYWSDIFKFSANGSTGQIILGGTHANYFPTFYSGNSERMRITTAGKVGIGLTAPTAYLHLKAGTAAANTAPLKFASGVSLTTAEAGAMEFTTDDLYFTITSGTARKGLILNDGTNLTSGKIPIATTNGRLTDGQTPLAGTKTYYVADSSGGSPTRKLTFVDGILTAET